MKRGKARGAQTAGQVGINHGFFLFRRVAQAASPVGLHNGFIHRCHRSANYDAYDIGPPESSYGAIDPAYSDTTDPIDFLSVILNSFSRHHC